MKIRFDKKIIEFNDLKNCNEFEKFFGLMFRNRKKARVLLFQFKKPSHIAIHSFFVFFPFIAVWLDDKNKIIEFKKIKPFTLFVRPKEFYYKLLEIPISEKYRRIVKLLCSQLHSLRF